MKRIRRFLMLRRRYDSVKMVFVFAAVAIVALVMLIDEAVLFYQQKNTIMEYELQKGNTVKAQDIENIEKEQLYVCSSFQKSDSITFISGDNEVTVDYILLEKDYIKEAYGCENLSGMETYYCNNVAWNIIAEALGDSGRSFRDSQREQLQIRDQDDSIRVAVLVKIQESDDNNAFIVRAGNRGELADTQQIRILLRQQDLHDDVYRDLTESGFTLKDNSEYTIMKKDSKIRWIKIQREAVVCVISAIAAVSIWKEAKHRWREG